MMTRSTQTPANPKHHLRTGLALATAALLAACGGGGDGGGTAVGGAVTTDATQGGTVLDASVVDNASTDLQLSIPALTYPATVSWRRAAHEYLNEQRGRCGFGLLLPSAALETAAQGHADYLARIVADKATGQYPNLFSQAPERPLYTASSPQPRARLAGYQLGYTAEVYAAPTWTQSPTATDSEKQAIQSVEAVKSVRSLLATSYSLAHLMAYNRYIGFGLGTASSNDKVESRFVTTLGRGVYEQANSREALSYPCEGSTGVEPAHLGDYAGDPTYGGSTGLSMPLGRGILVTAPLGKTLKVQTASITPIGSSAPAYIYGAAAPSGVLILSGTDPAGYNHRKEVAILHAHKPLAYATTYRVDLAFTVDGAAGTKTFTFTTRKASE